MNQPTQVAKLADAPPTISPQRRQTATPARDDALPRQHSWHRLARHAWIKPYNRLVVLVLAINAWWIWPELQALWLGQRPPLMLMSDAALVNFTVAILIRQQHVINLLFRLATSLPLGAPLWLRWAAGKVYHFGGIHVGAALAGSVWFALFAGATAMAIVGHGMSPLSPLSTFLVLAICALLALMLATAMPWWRQRIHDVFERSHRLAGWALLALFWMLSVSLMLERGLVPATDHLTLASADTLLAIAWQVISQSWQLACLALVTLGVALPWCHLRRVPVRFERPSRHVAIAHFDYGVTPLVGSSTTVSRRPLLEWHAFANIPHPTTSGYRLAISRAGDWTGALIDDLPERLWVKGIPTAGVGNVDQLFRKVLWVATGSGIGPVLPHILSGKVPSNTLWSTRSPRATYGDALVDEILTAQPDCVIWDTDTQGRPDLVTLTARAWRESGAEAVIVIANKTLTDRVVYAMESRGIPAFGAIWDS
ncbi:hypothetical protein LCL99_09565 [Halomonas denitrificans]|uniref:hypothetical protein n=1 Tax=Halomonas denitrificans TaxID=370769 RepID=UPI001CD3651D|nr:hypothetical protein [Halomonas denitrificans]MCA0974720.1 hypothetical protein [Halomonas denitrificans]